ncbi:MAG: hypothetical protein PWQ82_1017 [Thermosediminibacterales bacterium]|nr:hypothetical protein [Thermosediminibacterales bacterium]MDK2836203.1 hypothetical protein [Thermosediminibacterales bacterium]
MQKKGLRMTLLDASPAETTVKEETTAVMGGGSKGKCMMRYVQNVVHLHRYPLSL